jgi:hypothetical protein
MALDVAHVQGGCLGGGRPYAQQVRLDDDAARVGLKRVNASGCAPAASKLVKEQRKARAEATKKADRGSRDARLKANIRTS